MIYRQQKKKKSKNQKYWIKQANGSPVRKLVCSYECNGVASFVEYIPKLREK